MMKGTVRPVAAIALAASVLLSGCEELSRAWYISQYERTLDTYAQIDTTVTTVTSRTGADGRGAALISAFFGLDNALPKGPTDRVACEGGGGADGMPVIFSHEVDIKTLEPGDFRITTESGATTRVTCLTLAPADDPGELRTALLAGELGSAKDQPLTVEIVGNVLSLDGTLNFKGASVTATRLEAGPTLVWAEIVPEAQWELGKEATVLPWGGGERCPVGAAQVVRVTWGGGVTKPDGPDPADDNERRLYKVSVVRIGGATAEITPFALADLNDGDNNHLLCLDTTDAVTSVSFPAGYLTDPREDLNPDTTISVQQ
ncbi:MAG: hypothetical protein HXY22_01435 [Alphaproteobacteria bacterium]|nr:hypothetical protein [Alphaproteobacteria bacterium]